MFSSLHNAHTFKPHKYGIMPIKDSAGRQIDKQTDKQINTTKNIASFCQGGKTVINKP